MDENADEEKQGIQDAKPGKQNNNLISPDSPEEEKQENGKVTDKNNWTADSSLPHDHNDDTHSKSNTSSTCDTNQSKNDSATSVSCPPAAGEQGKLGKDEAAGGMVATCKGDSVERPSEMDVGSPEKSVDLGKAPSIVTTPTCSNTAESLIEKPKEDTSIISNQESKEPNIDFKVIFNKKKYDVSLPPDTDIGAVKTHLQTIIGIPPAMMKVMIKGLAKDEMTLKRLGVTKGSKVMVVGSTLNDVLQVSTTPKDTPKDLSSSATPKDSSSETCKQKQHKKILDRGKPEDAMPGVFGRKESLPTHPISGMVNKNGGKVRLTFKLEHDQVWIGTKERTEKLPLNSIKSVVSEPIDGHKEYHIVALQLGPTEASRYWIYWVPAQYVDAIKDAILGKWQLF